MKPVFSFLQRPYYLYRDRKHRWLIAGLISLFVWFFIFVFGAFDFDYFSIFRRFYLSGIYALGCWATLVLSFFVIQDLLIRKHTLGNTILFSFFYMFLIGCSNFVLTTLVFRWEEPRFQVFLKNQLYTLSLGMIITPFCILAYYNYLLRRRDHGGMRFGSDITETTIRLESEYSQGSIDLNIKDLLFIKSADNYIDVCFLNGKKVRHRLIRNTLSSVEKNLDHPGIVRCHRSYIINLHHVRSLRKGNRKLTMEVSQETIEIPLSRGYKSTVHTAYDRLH